MLDELSGKGHDVAPFDFYFHTGAIFFIFAKKCKKNENRLCPLPYDEENFEKLSTKEKFIMQKENIKISSQYAHHCLNKRLRSVYDPV